MKIKPAFSKKLILHKETLRVLTDAELGKVAGGDSTGASAGQSCECTLRCPKPPKQPTSSIIVTDGCPSVYTQL